MKNDEYNQEDFEQSYYEGNEGRSAGGAFNDSDDELSDCDLNTTSNLKKKLNQIINNEQSEENHFKKIIQLILQNIQISVDDIQITMIHNDVYNPEQHNSQEWVYQQMKQGNLVNYQDYLVIQLRQIHYQNILYSENGVDSKKSEIKVNGLQIHITDEKDDPIKFLDQVEQTEMIMLRQNSKSAVFNLMIAQFTKV
ncbi:hypothetical protein PPERSA_05837 [Pseudocohnilembus persalinus]|uniref:BRCT domain-containing protein n=1 Tax=Pseudocohnilembus persalinus TaxID=266149 RepID=A0A0V0R489_PSEPJ|nr:hypothetical protein PPERSA_05837 [Pseudocohnilembus persalinus]|eukprot:KRX09168.1 hypothetical protein PPERSA_05837 [Pseudocohnilembus persalinus]